MLKITLHREDTPARMVLEGRLAGAWVEEVRAAWRTFSLDGRPLLVDLTGVTYVDTEGKVLLADMGDGGAQFRAAGCCMKFLVEEITKGRRE
ncbi:hypothetical protein [Nitrospira moscoviensis]|uniref:STAS domain-containing protein n=1 Tax=Nitrospira moscoviensis TaxID=42253 RepID=A0A0K2G7B0_NITMO|nr:hypothetical protein [Nitrospira moscoviensis]ALA56467.1 hypothetical protein NITMOv2_0023 [Nitrospira moscoviensis]